MHQVFLRKKLCHRCQYPYKKVGCRLQAKQYFLLFEIYGKGALASSCSVQKGMYRYCEFKSLSSILVKEVVRLSSRKSSLVPATCNLLTSFMIGSPSIDQTDNKCVGTVEQLIGLAAESEMADVLDTFAARYQNTIVTRF